MNEAEFAAQAAKLMDTLAATTLDTAPRPDKPMAEPGVDAMASGKADWCLRGDHAAYRGDMRWDVTEYACRRCLGEGVGTAALWVSPWDTEGHNGETRVTRVPGGGLLVTGKHADKVQHIPIPPKGGGGVVVGGAKRPPPDNSWVTTCDHWAN